MGFTASVHVILVFNVTTLRLPRHPTHKTGHEYFVLLSLLIIAIGSTEIDCNIKTIRMSQTMLQVCLCLHKHIFVSFSIRLVCPLV